VENEADAKWKEQQGGQRKQAYQGINGMEVRLKASLKQMIGKTAMKKYDLEITSTLYQDDNRPISTVCGSCRILEFERRICHFYRLHI